jgi:hypothetical protein
MQVSSYTVMKHLSDDRAPVVYFQTTGLGYYTLQANSQGLCCGETTRFIVLVDELPRLNVMQIVGEKWMEDTLGIKDEYMSRRSAELAVWFYSGANI